MLRRFATPLCLVWMLTGSCIVPKDAHPAVDIGVKLPSKFVHRGMTLVDEPVLQPSLAVGIPIESGGLLGLTVDGNIDLRDDTGNAWFPDGHAGRFTQIEMIADYTHKIGVLTLRGGIDNYNLANGMEFIAGSPAGGERGSTNEVFLLASVDVLEVTPYASWNYDFDEARASYYRVGLSEGFDLGKGFSIRLDGSLSYAASGQAFWMYGIAESGFADLRAEAVLAWLYDDRTTFELGVHGSLIVDNTIDDWFAQNRIDDDVIWVSAGVVWRL